MGFDFAGSFPLAACAGCGAMNFRAGSCASIGSPPDDLIYPVFVLDGAKREEPVRFAAGHLAQDPWISCSMMPRLCAKLSIPALALFPVVASERKTPDGAEAWNPEGLVPRAVRALKDRFPISA